MKDSLSPRLMREIVHDLTIVVAFSLAIVIVLAGAMAIMFWVLSA